MKSSQFKGFVMAFVSAVSVCGCIVNDGDTQRDSQPTAQQSGMRTPQNLEPSEARGTEPSSVAIERCDEQENDCLPTMGGTPINGDSTPPSGQGTPAHSDDGAEMNDEAPQHMSNMACRESLSQLHNSCFVQVMGYRLSCFDTGNGCPQRTYSHGVARIQYPNGARVEYHGGPPTGGANPQRRMNIRYYGADGRLCLTTSIYSDGNDEPTLVFRAGNGAEFSMTRDDEESDPTILCSDGTEVQLSEEHEFLLDECGEEPAESSAEAEMGATDPCAEEESGALHHNVGQACADQSDCFGDAVGCCSVEDDRGQVTQMCLKEQICNALEARRDGRNFHLGCNADDPCSNEANICCIVSRDDGSTVGTCLPEAACDVAQQS